jgi:hypothetical protein
MATTREMATDKRVLIKHTFEREGESADTPVIEVVYEVRFPEMANLANDVKILNRISVTRTDTRESAILTSDEEKRVSNSVSEFAACMTEDW